MARHERAFGSRERAEGESNGEPARSRTENQQIKSLLLCQLSYGPTREEWSRRIESRRDWQTLSISSQTISIQPCVSARYNHPLAMVHSRFTVDGEIRSHRAQQDGQRGAMLWLAEGVRLCGAGRWRDAAAAFESGDRVAEAGGVRNTYVLPLLPWLATAYREDAETMLREILG